MARKIEADFVRDAGMGIKCNVRDRIRIAGKPIVFGQMAVHDLTCGVTFGVPFGNQMLLRIAPRPGGFCSISRISASGEDQAPPEKKRAARVFPAPPMKSEFVKLQAARRLTAFAPRASGWMSKATRWPSFSVRMPAASTAVAWTNTSFPPPSGEMKP